MKKIVILIKLVCNAFFPWVDPVKKQSARFELIRGGALLFNIQVYNNLLWWHEDVTYKKMWVNFPMANNKVHERRFNLFNLAKLAKGLNGDSAECGVFRGAGSYIILSALSSKDNKHHIFDSFEGLSVPEHEDVINDNELPKWAKGDLTEGETVVKKNLSLFSERIKLYQGWIPTRYSEVSDRTFCLVHIDVDLYQPTKDTLMFFYPRLVTGGLIICDDYGFKTCPGATKAMDEFFEDKPESVVHLTSGTGFIVKS